MTSQPVLRTARLTLRPLTLDDAPSVQRLAGAREVALNTASIPHPYVDGTAEWWITHSHEEYAKGTLVNFAIDDGEFAGAIGLIFKDEGIAEIGYWVGVPFWGRGYASEATAEIIRHGFEDRGLQRVYAGHYTRNPASGRVMQKN